MSTRSGCVTGFTAENQVAAVKLNHIYWHEYLHCIRRHYLGKKVNQSNYRPEVPRGFQEVKVSRLRDIGPGWW